MGIEAAEHPGLDKPFGHDDARYVEIWNLVFMQFDRSAIVDAATKPCSTSAHYPAIPSTPAAGWNAVAAFSLQGKSATSSRSLYAADRARNAGATNIPYAGKSIEELVAIASLRIIFSDHARAATFLINDGVIPANEGRGYVLRKILRRGIRHGRLLGQEKPFLFDMVYAVRDLMEGAYPELIDSASRVAKVIEAEEKQFDRVLKIGLTRLDEELKGNFTGDKAFHLYETFGLPLDFMVDAARDAGVTFDDAGFTGSRRESEQARRPRQLEKAAARNPAPALHLPRICPRPSSKATKQLNSGNAEVLAIVKGGLGVPAAKAGDEVEVVLDHTSFYGDSGGQVGDTGSFTSTDGNTTVAGDPPGAVLPESKASRAHKGSSQALARRRRSR